MLPPVLLPQHRIHDFRQSEYEGGQNNEHSQWVLYGVLLKDQQIWTRASHQSIIGS